MRLKFLLIFASLFADVLSASAETPEQILDRNLHSQVKSYTLAAQNILEGLAQMSGDFDLPMGIEWEESSGPFHPVNLTYSRPTTPWQVLQDVVAAEPPYTMTTSNGVVHVGKAATSNDTRNFLNLTVGDFQASDEYVFDLSYRRLHKQVLEQANPAPGPASAGRAGSNTVGAGDRAVSFVVHNATVSDIHDRFVTSAGFNIWLVTYPEAKTVTGRGFFKTISIFSAELPDNLLPTWDLLRPGYDPVRKQNVFYWKRGRWAQFDAPEKK
jgi:hypothetical protein